MHPSNPGHPGYNQPGGPGYIPANDPGNPASPMHPSNPGHPGYNQPGGPGHNPAADPSPHDSSHAAYTPPRGSGHNPPPPPHDSSSASPPCQEGKVELTLEEVAAGTCYKVGHFAVVGIPRGIPDGHQVPLRGTRDDGKPKRHLRIGVRPHPVFKREGNDLLMDLDIDLRTAVLGGKVKVPTLEKSVLLRIRPGTQSYDEYKLVGLGMPKLEDPDRRGQLIVQVRVRSPQDLYPE